MKMESDQISKTTDVKELLNIEGEEEDECDFDFSACSITISEAIRNVTKKAVWVLKNVDSQCTLENLLSEVEFVMEMGEKLEKPLKLRFFFNKLEETTKDNVKCRYLSLCVGVLQETEKRNGPLTFTVKVDCLTEDLWANYTQLPETAVSIESEVGWTVVEKHFMKYAVRFPTPTNSSRGLVKKWTYLLHQTDNFNFGITVATVQIITGLENQGSHKLVNLDVQCSVPSQEHEEEEGTTANLYKQYVTKPKGASTDAVARNFILFVAESLLMMIKWHISNGKGDTLDDETRTSFRINEVVARPFLSAVLTWFKYGKLTDKTSRKLENVVGRETELLEMLECEAVRICDSDYMFQSASGKEIIVKRVSQLIKEFGNILRVRHNQL